MNFGRVIEVLAGGMVLSSNDFNIEGTVPFDADPVPNEAEIRIWNLRQDTINRFRRGSILKLNAGYRGDVGTILHGYITQVRTARKGVDAITTIHVLDGPDLSAIKASSKAYAAGTFGSYILRDLAGALGLPIAQLQLNQDYRYTEGLTIDGPLTDSMLQVVKDCGTSFYINKGNIYVRPLRIGADSLFALSAESGLIGWPEPIEGDVSGYTLRSQLQYRITTASVIALSSAAYTGRLHVRSGSHTLSLTGDFMTEMEAIR
jgi:hypothetical protein